MQLKQGVKARFQYRNNHWTAQHEIQGWDNLDINQGGGGGGQDGIPRRIVPHCGIHSTSTTTNNC